MWGWRGQISVGARAGACMSKKFKVGAAVGSGIVARAAERGGADFLLTINAGRMRSMGMPSIACMLPIRAPLDATLPFAAREVLPQASVPVYFGLAAWSGPRDLAPVIRAALAEGFAGVANFPSAMHFSRGMRRLLDRAGIGTRAEIALLQEVQRAGGRTLFYCGAQDEARRAAEAGLDAIVFNLGWNIGGADSHTTEISLEEAAQQARTVTRLARGRRPKMEVFLEGGPILSAEDLNFVIRHADIDGYVGGSTIDRFPVQHSVTNQIAEYKSAALWIGGKTRELQAAIDEAGRYGLVGQSAEFAEFAAALLRTRAGRGHVHLRAPEGVDLQAALNMLARGADRARPLPCLDFGESCSAHRTNDRLFGRCEDGQRKSGLLHSGADFIVLRNCAAMPRLIRRKLYNAMLTGRAQRIGGRERLPLSPRLVLVSGPGFDLDWGELPLARVDYPGLRARHLDLRLILEDMLGQYLAPDCYPDIRPAAWRVLGAHDWPGNEAELRRLAMLMARQAAHKIYEAHDMRLLLRGRPATAREATTETAMRQQLLQALARNGFRKGATARMLNISRKTLYNRMKRFGFG